MKPWVKMPAAIVRDDKLKRLLWVNDSIGKRAHKVAALKIFLALSMCAEKEEVYNSDFDDYSTRYAAQLTYERLGVLTALSRNSISEGIKILIDLEVINVHIEGRKSIYQFCGFTGDGHWSKLPCQALLSRDGKRIEALHKLKLRSKIELYALKMYLYLCTVRDNKTPYASASFEKINEQTSIPEKDIPRTHAYLSGIGLIALVEKRQNDNSKSKANLPNAYYLTGYSQLFVGMKA